METYQIVLVGIAGLIGLSMVWPKITNVVKNVSHKPQPEEEFMQIIAGWNSFKGQCEDAGLDTVCEKLCEIFPLLIKADEVHTPQDDKEPNDE